MKISWFHLMAILLTLTFIGANYLSVHIGLIHWKLGEFGKALGAVSCTLMIVDWYLESKKESKK